MKNAEIELVRLRMSVEAIRERVNQDLEAVAAEIERLLPEEEGDRSQVPTKEELLEIVRRKFRKEVKE